MNNKLIKKRYKRPYISTYFSIKPQTCDENLNLRQKSLAVLDTRIKASFARLNSIINKINNSKDSILNNKFDIRDVKLMKNLDSNCLLLCKSFSNEAKKASKLSNGYNLSSYDLDAFIKDLRKKKKKYKVKHELNKNNEISKDNIDNYKTEFNLASLGQNKQEIIKNNSFLNNQRKMRDLYNLKLELMFIERRKKIGEKKSFEVKENKGSKFLKDKERKRKSQYDRIKSRYYNKYKISKSFEIKENLIEQYVLKDINKIGDENDNKNKEEIFITSNKEEKTNTNNQEIFPKRIVIKELNKINNYNFNFKNNQINKKRKSFSASNIKNNIAKKYINNSAIINSGMNNNAQLKQPINLRLKSGINIGKNKIIRTSIYNTIYNNNSNRKYRNSRLNNLASTPTNTKKTIYTTNKTLSRPISSFSSFNNTTYHFNINKSNVKINNSTLGSKKKLANYISTINNIIKYSDYTTEKFKKETSEFNKKKLFMKSNNKIFEKKKIVDINKIIKNLALDKNPHSFINDKKLIYNNSLKVKPLLNNKNKLILNTFLLTIFDEDRRLNKNFIDASEYEKAMKKNEMNKVFNILSNKIINFEKKYDKEKILEIFAPDDVNTFLKNRGEMFNKYDEKEYQFLLLKNQNMKIMEKENNRKKNINGNLYKKHLVAKYKKKE